MTRDMTEGGVVTCNKVDDIVAGEGEKPVGCQQS